MAVRDELPVALPPEWDALYRATSPSADLLAEVAPVASGSRVLLLGCAADPFCLVAARRAQEGACVVADDDAAAGATLSQLASTARLRNVRVMDPAALAAPDAASQLPAFDLAIANTLYHPSKHLTVALLALAHARLAPGGELYVAGARNRGILSIADEGARLFGNIATPIMRKGHRVVSATRVDGPPASTAALLDTGDESRLERVVVRGQPLALAPTPLVFAGGRLDPAAALLAESIEVAPDDVVADLGCGAGAVGLVAARLAPAGHVYLLDASYAAARTAAANARRNGIANVTALAGDGLALLQSQGVRPSVIATNPPFHTGQVQSRLMAQRFIAGAAERLAPGGHLYLVANRFLPYEADLRQHFADVSEVVGDARFKVLRAQAPTTAPS